MTRPPCDAHARPPERTLRFRAKPFHLFSTMNRRPFVDARRRITSITPRSVSTRRSSARRARRASSSGRVHTWSARRRDSIARRIAPDRRLAPDCWRRLVKSRRCAARIGHRIPRIAPRGASTRRRHGAIGHRFAPAVRRIAQIARWPRAIRRRSFASRVGSERSGAGQPRSVIESLTLDAGVRESRVESSKVDYEQLRAQTGYFSSGDGAFPSRVEHFLPRDGHFPLHVDELSSPAG